MTVSVTLKLSTQTYFYDFLCTCTTFKSTTVLINLLRWVSYFSLYNIAKFNRLVSVLLPTYYEYFLRIFCRSCVLIFAKISSSALLVIDVCISIINELILIWHLLAPITMSILYYVVVSVKDFINLTILGNPLIDNVVVNADYHL